MTVAMAAAAWIVMADRGTLQMPSAALAAGVLWFAVSGILTIFLGRTLLYQSIASIGAIRASMLLRLHPFFSVLLAALILGETVGAIAAGGMLLIMLSFALLLRRAFGQRPPAAQGTAVEARASPLDYVHGPASAFSYALGAIARKHALGLVPDTPQPATHP
jgi:drug/metabolite transporter (DMT)-like permease